MSSLAWAHPPRVTVQDTSCDLTIVFEHLYRTNFKPLRNIIYRKTGNPYLSEDIAHSALASLLVQLKAGKKIFKVRSWLIIVAENLLRDENKLAFNRLRSESDFWAINKLSPDGEPLGNLLRGEEHLLLRQAIDDLKEKDKEILQLHYYQGLCAEEIAQLRGCKVSAVYMALSRARQRLKDRMQELCAHCFH